MENSSGWTHFELFLAKSVEVGFGPTRCVCAHRHLSARPEKISQLLRLLHAQRHAIIVPESTHGQVTAIVRSFLNFQ
jgi:hypothetical protein